MWSPASTSTSSASDWSISWRLWRTASAVPWYQPLRSRDMNGWRIVMPPPRTRSRSHGRPIPMWSISERGLYCVSTRTFSMSEFAQLDRLKSMSRNLPPNGTAGLERMADRTESRSPAPPASTTARTWRMAFTAPASRRGVSRGIGAAVLIITHARVPRPGETGARDSTARTRRAGATALREPNDADQPDDEAVDRERGERPGGEVTGQETHREVRGDARRDAPGEDLRADAVAVVAEQVGQLVDARGQDDRRREEEREAGRVFVVEATHESRHHRDSRAADARQERERLGEADRPRDPEPQVVEPAAVRGRLPTPRCHGTLRPAPNPLAAQQDHAIHDEEARGGERLREDHAQGMLEEHPRQPGRDGRDDQEPPQALVRRLDPPRPDRCQDAPDDPCPGLAVEDDQRQRRRDMEPDEQRQEVGLGRRLRRDDVAPSEELGQDHRVPEARDGEELGDTLEQPEDDRLEEAQHRASLPVGGRAEPGRRRHGDGRASAVAGRDVHGRARCQASERPLEGRLDPGEMACRHEGLEARRAEQG